MSTNDTVLAEITGAGLHEVTNECKLPVNEKRVLKLVIDSNVLFKKIDVWKIADEIYTVPECIEEIKDQETKKYLSLLPKDVKIVSPNQVHVSRVIQLCKKTGDYFSLSKADIKLLALVYELEIETFGKDHIEERISEFSKKASEIHYSYGQNECEGGDDTSGDEDDNKDGDDEDEDEGDKDGNEDGDKDGNEDGEWTVVKPKKGKSFLNKKKQHTEPFKSTDFGRWITPSNINSVLLGRYTEPTLSYKDAVRNIAYNREPLFIEDSTNSNTPSNRSITNGTYTVIKVAICSSDYAVQNAAVSMAFNVISSRGSIINKARVYVLRCHACHEVTRNFTKLFCPRCGNNTLLKATSTIDKDGKLTIFLRKNFQYRTRGTIYPVPLPRSGKNSNNLILRDDQRELQIAKRNATSVLPPALTEFAQIVEPVKMPPKIIIGYGKNNPNEVSRRNHRRSRKV